MMRRLYTVSQIRSIEEKAIKTGITAYELMQCAGFAAFKILRHYYPHLNKIDVVCGKGNNGGDGYIIALLAAEHGIHVNLYALAEISVLPSPAKKAAQACLDKGLIIQPYSTSVIFKGELIVDAILGIGVQGALRGVTHAAICAMNASKIPIVAIDIPSGLDANQGSVLNDAIKASLTITFIGIKQGMLTGEAPNYCGKILCDNLKLPSSLYDLSATTVLLENNVSALPVRKPASHKGNYGHVLIIGGDRGMGGAVCLAAEAALKSGAGIVSVVTCPEHVPVILTRCPEIMVRGIENIDGLNTSYNKTIANLTELDSFLPDLLKKATVCVIGPGLGESIWGQTLLAYVLNTQLPLIVDASALRLLAKNYSQLSRSNWILTPHPGEAATLAGVSSKDIQQARFDYVKKLQERWDGVIVLKGAGTLIYDGNQPVHVSSVSNPAMASAGMGDVLSGIIGSLLAQGCSLFEAASYGVWLHAHAGKLAKNNGFSHQSILAHELFPYLSFN